MTLDQFVGGRRGRLRRHGLVAVLSFSLIVSSLSGAGLSAVAWAAGPDPHGPGQQGGSAAGRDHRASAADTEAGRGIGQPPGHAKGELGRYQWPTRRGASFKTGDPFGPFDRARAKRLPDKATEYADVYEGPDGRLQREFSTGRRNYRDAKGIFQPIDPTLESRGGRFRERANDLAIEVAGKGNDANLARLGTDAKHVVGQALAGAAAVAPSVDGSTARYVEILQDTDLVLYAGPAGVKETLWLKSPSAPTSFVFPLDLTGLTAKVNAEGGLDFLDADGKVVAFSPHGSMVDSKPDPSGEGAYSDAVTYTLITAGDKPAVRVDIDPDWAHDAARVYPIQVDPSTLFSTGSSTFTDKYSAANRSTSATLAIGSYDNGVHQARTYLEFPEVTNVPPSNGTHATAASLNLFLSYAACATSTFQVRPITSSWTASTLTTYSTTVPSVGSLLGSATPALTSSSPPCNNPSVNPAIGQSVTVALSPPSIFDTWRSPTRKYGLELEPAALGGTTSWKRFNAFNTVNPPTLSITYANNIPGQVDTAYAGNLGTLTPEFIATGHDPDVFPKSPVKYRFKVFPAGYDPGSGVSPVADSGLIATGNWTVPAGVLTWAKNYEWTVQIYDGQDYGPADTINFGIPFDTAVPLPKIGATLTRAGGDRPFDANTGNVTAAATDASVATVGPGLSIDRVYNSRDVRTTGAFGAGWSSVLDMSAAERKHPVSGALSAVVITYPNGERAAFGRAADGSFVAPEGRFATLSTVSGGYRLIDNAQTTWLFTRARTTGPAGVYGLTSITDAPGRIQSWTWTGDTVTKVTTASGRSLTLTWTTPAGATAAHVATVLTDRADANDPASAQQWTYTYSGDRLTKVCPPDSATACTTYAWTDGAHYPTSVLDSDPHSYYRLGDTPGAFPAADSVVDNQNALTGAWVPQAPGRSASRIGGGAQASNFSSASQTYVLVPQDEAQRLASQSVSLWFKTTTGNTALLGAHADPLSNGTATGWNINALYVGTDNKLHAQLGWAGAVNMMTSALTVTDGQWHHVVITAAGGPTPKQVLYLDGVPSGNTIAQSGYSAGAFRLTVGAGFLGGGWPASTPTTAATANYFTGSISDVAFWTRTLSDAEVGEQYARATSAPAALLSKITTPGGRTALTATYDTINDAATSVTDANGGTWTITSTAVTGSSYGYRGQLNAASPYTYWRLGDTAATQAVDQTGHIDANGNFDRYGAYSNVTLGQIGPFGVGDSPAPNFNGTTSVMRAPATVEIGARNTASVSLMFKTTSTTDGVLYGAAVAQLAGTTTAAGYVPILYLGTGGKLYGQLWNGTVNPIVTANAVNDGAWHQVVIAGGGGTQTLYLDGIAVGTRSGTIGASGMLADTVGGGFNGGAWPAQANPNSSVGHPRYFAGSIAEVAVYDYALNANQVNDSWFAYKLAATTYPVKSITMTDPTGKTATDIYDPSNDDRVLSQTDTTGGRTVTDYDTGGFVAAVTDPNGHSVTIGNDARGNMLSRVTCQDQSAQKCQTERWKYHPVTAILDAVNDHPEVYWDPRTTAPPAGQNPTDTRYRTDAVYQAQASPGAGQPATITGPVVQGAAAGQVDTMTYTDANTPAAEGGGLHPPAGLVATQTSPPVGATPGATTSYTYYANGDLATLTDPLGLLTRYTYDGLGRVSTTTVISDSYPSGLTTGQTWDARNRVITRTEPGVTDVVTGIVHTAKTTTVYDPDSLVTSTTVADLTGGDPSRTNSATFDTYGQQASATDATGAVESYLYDVYGRRTQVTSADGTVRVTAYDSEGRVLTVTLKNFTGDALHPAGDLVLESNAYDPAGRLASTTDAMGWTTTNTYFDNGQLAKVTRSDGTRTFVTENNTYDNAGNLIQKITNDGATTTTYTLDATGRVTSETLDPAGVNRTTARTFDAEDRVTTVTVTGGGKSETVDTAYDIVGNIKRVTVHDGTQDKITSWAYDKRGLPISMTDPLGNSTPDPLDGITYYVNDEAGHQITVMSPAVPTESGIEGAAPQTLAAITRTGYNTFGEAVSAQDANGNITATGYDKAGRPVSTTAPAYTPPGSSTALQPVTTTSYDAMGRVIDETDALGAHTTYVWDQLGHQKSMTAPGAATTTFTVDVLGDVLATVSPIGARTESTWDWMGRKATDTHIERYPTPVALVTTYTYGTGGWLTQQRSPAGVITSSTYNAAGETATATDGAGNISRFSYDLKGRQIRVDYPDDTARTTSYSATGNQLTTADLDRTGAVLRTTSNGYDLADRRTSMTDGLGRTTTWTRDALGIVTQQVEPVTGSTSITTGYAHDPRGNTTRFTDGRGNPFRTTWNSWNLIESRIEPSTAAHPNLSDRTWTTAYDAAGRSATVTAPGAVVTTSAYDARGNLTGQAGSGADAPTANRSFTYDTDNRMLTANVPTAADSFTYDDRGNLLTTAGPSGAATFGYDADARMTSRADAAGTSTYTWDSAGRLKTLVDAATGATVTRSYDTMNQLRTISYGTGAATRTFAYDDLHRLTGDTLTAPGGATEAAISYGYDLADRRTSRTTTGLAGAGNDTYGYDHAGRLTSWTHQTTSIAYTYDASGNRIGISGRTQTFDARNRITTATDTAGTTTWTWTPRGTLAATTGAKTRAATFDAFDQLITDTATPGNPSASGDQTYTYDALARQITAAPTSGATGPTATLTYSGTGHDLAGDTAATYALDPAGGLLATRNGGSAAHALADAHDDVIAAFTTTGTTLSGSVAYDPLGNTTATAGTMPGNTGYQGEWTDPATGQVDMWHRHYDPSSSGFDNADPTWQSPDPASIAANRYAYGDGDPLDHTDPTGFGTLPDPALTTSGEGGTHDQEVAAESERELAAYRLSKAIEKLLTDTKIDQATAADLRPIVYGTRTEAKHFDMVFGGSWRVLANMAADCVKPNRGGWCEGRHSIDVTRKYRWGEACRELSFRCLFGIAGVVLEAVLTYSAVKAFRIWAGGRGGAVAAGTLIDVKISWKALTTSQAAKVAGALSDRIVAVRVKFQRMGRQVGVPVLKNPCLNSFTGDTLVLMADGTTKPIKDVELGDKVIATDPETGKTGPRKVIDLIQHDGLHTMIAVRLSDGSTIDATDHHPFWVESRKAWVDAIDLQPGDILITADGDPLTVERLGISEQDLTAFNLTVAGLHTYYVLPTSADGATVREPILVHNAGCPPYLVRRFNELGQKITPKMAKATGPQIRKLAEYLKLRPTNELSQGQLIYTDGKRFFVYDNTAHKGGFWKMGKTTAKLKTGNAKDRDGTYDLLLNRIAD